MTKSNDIKGFVYRRDAEGLYLALQDAVPANTHREQLTLVAAAATRSLAMTRMLVNAGYSIAPIEEGDPDPVEAARDAGQVDVARWLLVTRISSSIPDTKCNGGA